MFFKSSELDIRIKQSDTNYGKGAFSEGEDMEPAEKLPGYLRNDRPMNQKKKENVLAVTLHRREPKTPWGVRIVGGSDLGTPILVTRVQSRSPGEKILRPGDIIKKIEDYDSRDISHHDANRLFVNAGTSIRLVIERESGSKESSDRFNKLPVHAEQGTGRNQKVVFPPPNPITQSASKGELFRSATQDNLANPEISNQPYRTTPLVLPGAKTKHEKELAPTESYLRHHPNPVMRAPPSHHHFLPLEVVMKQKPKSRERLASQAFCKLRYSTCSSGRGAAGPTTYSVVADSVLQRVTGDEAFAGKQVVHKQFNTPIGLYSDQNILDTIHHQTGISTSGVGANVLNTRPAAKSLAPKKTVLYDPAKSETFKALQEEQYGDTVQEVKTPAQPKVFTPKKVQHQPPQSHTYNPLSRSTASPSLQHHLPYLNSMGHSDEHIAQSGSFKRLMNMVMGESEY